MSGNGTPLPLASNLPEFTVGEISRAIRRTLEGEFAQVRVRGEITGFKRAASGHCYFRLKDEDAVIDAVCWKNNAARLEVKPEDGLEVVATGRVTTYAGRSVYQLVIERIELAGEGALLKLLEERRRRLAAEGLFDETRKRPLPYLPTVIGVVTSPTGAVIRDILHRLRDRFPRHVLLWPVQVQGDGAAEQVAAAVHGFASLPAEGPVPRPDVLIVARGGGSLEDLWAFNEEVAVRAVAACGIPVIAAVGHETDTTLIDFAADRRAPTPTAAAEMAVPVRAELVSRIKDLDRRLGDGVLRLIEEREHRVESAGRGLPRPEDVVERAQQTVDDLADRLVLSTGHLLEVRRGDVGRLAAGLRHPRDRIEAAEDRLRAATRQHASALRHVMQNATHALDRIDAGRRLPTALARGLDDREKQMEVLGGLLRSYSYESVLERGFVLVRDGDRPLTDAEQALPGMTVTLEFRGRQQRRARIEDEEPETPPSPSGRSGKRRSTPSNASDTPVSGPRQGKLL